MSAMPGDSAASSDSKAAEADHSAYASLPSSSATSPLIDNGAGSSAQASGASGSLPFMCPVCALTMVVMAGTQPGSLVYCPGCSTVLLVPDVPFVSVVIPGASESSSPASVSASASESFASGSVSTSAASVSAGSAAGSSSSSTGVTTSEHMTERLPKKTVRWSLATKPYERTVVGQACPFRFMVSRLPDHNVQAWVEYSESRDLEAIMRERKHRTAEVAAALMALFALLEFDDREDAITYLQNLTQPKESHSCIPPRCAESKQPVPARPPRLCRSLSLPLLREAAPVARAFARVDYASAEDLEAFVRRYSLPARALFASSSPRTLADHVQAVKRHVEFLAGAAREFRDFSPWAVGELKAFARKYGLQVTLRVGRRNSVSDLYSSVQQCLLSMGVIPQDSAVR